MSHSTCSIEGCGSTSYVRGWCVLHYSRWKRLGDPGEAARRISTKSSSLYERVAAAGWTVTDRGCWESSGSHNRHGYGTVHTPSDSDGRRTFVLSHRVAFEHHHGALALGEVARHTCDNPPCVNPDHLIRGTQADNVADMWERGRGITGLAHMNGRLTDEQVHDIRRRGSEGETHQSIADDLGISREHAGNIIRGKRRARTA